MQGVEISHLNATLSAALMAYEDLMGTTAGEALRQIHKYGKSDTLGLDAMPEITIVDELCKHDRNAIVITEEIGSGEHRKIEITPVPTPRAFRTLFISDPTDRSAQLKQFLSSTPPKQRIGDIFRDPGAQKKWMRKFGGPASITGSTSAISCVRHGVPIFAVIVNYVTQQMFVACGAGNLMIDLPSDVTDKIDFNYIVANGRPILFPDIDGTDMRRFVTFLGKEGYRENLIASRLIEEGDLDRFLHYGLPGGPSRALYLSALLAKSKKRVGFVLANGEKIGEWIHWLPFVRFARNGRDLSAPALRLFEVYQDRPGTKDGVLMATPPIYSIFKPISETDPRMIIDVNSLANFPNPSKVRATLIVAPCDNRWATRSVNQYGYRPIELYSEV